jgi:hypothetical protein
VMIPVGLQFVLSNLLGLFESQPWKILWSSRTGD